MDILKQALENKEYAVKCRRYLHSVPEKGMEEYKTSSFIKNQLTQMNIPFEEKAKTGVVATIQGTNKGKTVALRADIDALEITEENDLDFKSCHPGMMHACGHDCHTAMLLAAGKILNENKNLINGTVKLIFQPCEESNSKNESGAKYIVQDGGIQGVDAIFGMHIYPYVPFGTFYLKSGAMLASSDYFSIEVQGKSGHGSNPDLCVDATVIASEIVMSLQTLVSRRISPLENAVVSVGKLYSGTRYNVISGKAVITGTVRTFNESIRQNMPSMISQISENIAKAHGGTAEVKYDFMISPVINDKKCSDIFTKSAEKILGEKSVFEAKAVMGGEDFSEYLRIIPGSYGFLGVGSGDKEHDILHSEKLIVNEEILYKGAAVYAETAIDYLNS